MKSLASNQGYVLIDNRASGDGMQEFDTITCVHCQRTWRVNPLRTRPRNFCMKCNAYHCDNRACHECKGPFWKMIEDMQTKIVHDQIAAKL